NYFPLTSFFLPSFQSTNEPRMQLKMFSCIKAVNKQHGSMVHPIHIGTEAPHTEHSGHYLDSTKGISIDHHPSQYVHGQQRRHADPSRYGRGQEHHPRRPHEHQLPRHHVHHHRHPVRLLP
ncbi:hypothetical protein Tsubulata_011067, partial [Turnera subulata]